MEPSNNDRLPKKGTKTVTAVVSLIIFFGILFGVNKLQQTPSTEPVATVPSTGTTTAASGGTPLYKDGSYSAEGSYISPGGEEKVAVSLTLDDDVVTAATVTSEAGDPTSRQYQGMFISGYTQYVVGQNIDTLHLSRVSGSSLTSGGFNEAVSKIKTEAKA